MIKIGDKVREPYSKFEGTVVSVEVRKGAPNLLRVESPPNERKIGWTIWVDECDVQTLEG